MICDAFHRSHLAGATLGICACLSLACGEFSDSSDGSGDSGGRSGRGGSGGRAGSAGLGGQMSRGGTSGMDLADAGPDATGGVSGSGGTGVISDCPTPAPIPVDGQIVAIQSIHFGRSEVVLKNVTDTDQTILGGEPLGWQWCNVPGYFIITATDIVLPPGATHKLFMIERTGGTRPLFPGTDPESTDVTEMAIYDRAGSYTTPEFMLAFVAWGQGMAFGLGREPVAVEANLWTLSDRVEITRGHAGLIATGRTDRGDGYTSVPERCLPP